MCACDRTCAGWGEPVTIASSTALIMQARGRRWETPRARFAAGERRVCTEGGGAGNGFVDAQRDHYEVQAWHHDCKLAPTTPCVVSIAWDPTQRFAPEEVRVVAAGRP